jgi:hypothetical protein
MPLARQEQGGIMEPHGMTRLNQKACVTRMIIAAQDLHRRRREGVTK